jgi:hypothetical protein
MLKYMFLGVIVEKEFVVEVLPIFVLDFFEDFHLMWMKVYGSFVRRMNFLYCY